VVGGVWRWRETGDGASCLGPVPLHRSFDRLPGRLSGSLTLECLVPARVDLLSKDCFGWGADISSATNHGMVPGA
jgi:hypothetical protein